MTEDVRYTAYLSGDGYAVWDHVRDELVSTVDTLQHAEDLARHLNWLEVDSMTDTPGRS